MERGLEKDDGRYEILMKGLLMDQEKRLRSSEDYFLDLMADCFLDDFNTMIGDDD